MGLLFYAGRNVEVKITITEMPENNDLWIESRSGALPVAFFQLTFHVAVKSSKLAAK